jgi:hypothetical protein
MLALVAFVRVADADPPAPTPETNASKPEHLAQAFIQYGLAFTAEFVAAPGPICNFANAPSCILNSGGGLSVRLGRRLRGPFYFGAAYEFTKMDSAQLYRVGILQQARAEGRYYLFTGRSVEPWLGAAVGADFYGNLWAWDTGGPLLGASLGVEFQISTVFTLGVALSYHALFFIPFTDSANTARPPPGESPGFSHLIGLDLIVESRDPF